MSLAQDFACRFGSVAGFFDYFRHLDEASLLVCSAFEDFLEICVEDGLDVPQDIWLLSKSRQTRMAFVPSLAHLRAALGCFVSDASVLVVVNAIQMHQRRGEFSAQGISRTLSQAVEAARATNVRLQIAELQRPNFSSFSWDDKVPLLNGGIAGDREWLANTVELQQIVRQWLPIRESSELNE